MFCKEVYGIIKNKKARVFIIMLLLIAVLDLLQLIIEQHVFDYIIYNENRPAGNMLRHPSFAAFLSGSSHGHMWQMIVIWLMPIYILNIYSDSYIREKINGYTNIVILRTNRIKYIKAKYAVSFLAPCVIMFSILIFNWGLCNIIFYGGTSFQGLEYFAGSKGIHGLCFRYPNITYGIYMLVASVISGMCGIMCQSIAFITKDYKKSYGISMIIWMVLVLCPCSITYLYQPFIENYFIEMIIILGIFFILNLSFMITGVTKVKYEI